MRTKLETENVKKKKSQLFILYVMLLKTKANKMEQILKNIEHKN